MFAYMIAFVGLAVVTAIHIHIRDMEAAEKILRCAQDDKNGAMRASRPTRNGGGRGR